MMLTGLLVGAEGAQLALLFVGQLAFVCALFAVRPFRRPLDQVASQVVEVRTWTQPRRGATAPSLSPPPYPSV